jgi:hypothetical protein
LTKLTQDEKQLALQNTGTLKFFWLDGRFNNIWDTDLIHIDLNSTPQELTELVHRQVQKKFRDRQECLDDLRRKGLSMRVNCWASVGFNRSIYLNPDHLGVFRVARVWDSHNNPSKAPSAQSFEVIVEMDRMRLPPGQRPRRQQTRISQDVVDLRKNIQQSIRNIHALQTSTPSPGMYMVHPPMLTLQPYVVPLPRRPNPHAGGPLRIVAFMQNRTVYPQIKLPTQVILRLPNTTDNFTVIMGAIRKSWDIYSLKHYRKEFAPYVDELSPPSFGEQLKALAFVAPQIVPETEVDEEKRERNVRTKTAYIFRTGMDIEDFLDGRMEREINVEVHLVSDQD